jgi:SAM-dependent methyltransferase
MPSADHEYRLYGDLADWWPLISPPREYAEEAAHLAAVLSSSAAVRVHEVLDLGSGGGHIAMHLKDMFRLTLVDISDDMLEVSRRLNSECRHLRGDMRTIRLARTFDAILVHDAIDYITTQDDLARVIATAFDHCRPGGAALFVPDYVKDDFRELAGSGGGGTDGTGRQATFRERTWDPDRSDDWVQADYEFILRQADGSVEVIRESHRLGAFSRDVWQRMLTGAGFVAGTGSAGSVPGADSAGRALPGRPPAHMFLAHRPS